VWAKYTVRVLLLRNCVQAHDNTLWVLWHIIFYLSTRLPQIIGSLGHVRTCFFEIPYFQEFCLQDPKSTKIIKFAGPRPAPIPYGAGPLPPTKVGAKCLVAVVLAHHDRVLSRCRKQMKTKGKRLDGMVFTNANLRYAGKLDDPQGGGDTTKLMQQVKEVMMVNQVMEEKSSWIWLTSE